MTETDLPGQLTRLRELAARDPRRHGGELALLLADAGMRELRQQRWESSLVLLEEARHFTELAGGPAVKASLKNASTTHDLALKIFQGAVRTLPRGHVVTAAGLSRMGQAHLDRYERTGERADLDSAVGVCDAAVRAAPHEDADLLGQLGGALRTRFDLDQDKSDLDRAIECFRRAVQATPAGQPNESTWQSNLGTALQARFELTRDAEDLHSAIGHLEEAVVRVPAGHRDRPIMAMNLGAALRLRFELTSDPQDLDRAVLHLRDSLSGSGDGPGRTLCQSNLGIALLGRYQCDGQRSALEESVGLLLAAARDIPAGAPARPAILSSLAAVHCSTGRFTAARDLFAEALRAREGTLGRDHPDTLASRHNLAAVMATLGHLVPASDEFHEVLAARRRLLGDDHPETLASWRNLVTVLEDLGQSTQAQAERSRLEATRSGLTTPEPP